MIILTSFFYVSLFPFGIVITVTGVFWAYVIEIIGISCWYRKPVKLNEKLAVFYMRWSNIIILVNYAGNLIFIDDFLSLGSWKLVYTILIIVFSFFPSLYICPCFIPKVEESNYEDDYFEFETDYVRENPITEKEGREHYIEQMKKKGLISEEEGNDIMKKPSNVSLKKLYYERKKEKEEKTKPKTRNSQNLIYDYRRVQVVQERTDTTNPLQTEENCILPLNENSQRPNNTNREYKIQIKKLPKNDFQDIHQIEQQSESENESESHRELHKERQSENQDDSHIKHQPENVVEIRVEKQAQDKKENQSEDQNESQSECEWKSINWTGGKKESQEEGQGELQKEPKKECETESQSKPEGECQSESRKEAQSEPQKEPQKESEKEPLKKSQDERQSEMQKEPQKEFHQTDLQLLNESNESNESPSDLQKELLGESQSELQKEPKKEFQDECQSDLEGDSKIEFQKEPQKEPEEEPEKEPIKEPIEEPEKESEKPKKELQDECQSELQKTPHVEFEKKRMLSYSSTLKRDSDFEIDTWKKSKEC